MRAARGLSVFSFQGGTGGLCALLCMLGFAGTLDSQGKRPPVWPVAWGAAAEDPSIALCYWKGSHFTHLSDLASPTRVGTLTPRIPQPAAVTCSDASKGRWSTSVVLNVSNFHRPPSSWHVQETGSSPGPLRLCPLSFGEGVEFDPLPPKDIRYTSSVKYDSEKHFINNIYMPVRLGVASCSQTVICVPDSTWRSYKAEVQLQLCHQPRHFTSTTIVYPKHPKTVYTTTLDYNCKKFTRKFLSSVELESSGNDHNPDSC